MPKGRVMKKISPKITADAPQSGKTKWSLYRDDKMGRRLHFNEPAPAC